MTPEQNKHIEGIADYHSQLHNFGGAHPSYKDGLRNGFIAGAEYALAHLSPGGWVNVKHKLPSDKQYILCYGDGERQFTAYFNNRKFMVYDDDEFEECESVAYWMPLPKTPKGQTFRPSLPSDKDKDLSTNELFKFYIKNEPVNFYLSNILRLPEEKQIQLKDALADRLPKDDKDKEIQQLKAWKQEAMLVYAPIMDWGHANKELPLGASIVEEIMKRVKESEAKDKEIERLRGIINHVHNLAADDIPDGVGPCEDAARKIIDIDAYLTEALNTKEVNNGG